MTKHHGRKRARDGALGNIRGRIGNCDWRSGRQVLKELAFEIDLERWIRNTNKGKSIPDRGAHVATTQGHERSFRGMRLSVAWLSNTQVKAGEKLGWRAKLASVGTNLATFTMNLNLILEQLEFTGNLKQETTIPIYKKKKKKSQDGSVKLLQRWEGSEVRKEIL